VASAPNIASYLKFQNNLVSGAWFNVTNNPPKFIGSVSDAETPPENLVVYARLWTLDGKMVWRRTMTYTGLSGGAPVFEYQTVYNATGANETRLITFGDGITGGSWKLRFNFIDTEPIAWGWSEAQIKAAIERHPDIGAGNVAISWAASIRRLTVQFQGALAHTTIPDIGVTNSLTGTATGITMSTYTSGQGDFAFSTGTFLWDMVAYDGTRWSGDQPGPRSATGPTPVKFFLDFVPSVTSQSPANGATVTTPTPTMSWTTIQGTLGIIPITHIRGRLVDATDPLRPIVYTFEEKGNNLNILQSFIVPSGKLINGHSYDWYADVVKASGAFTTWKNTFTVSYVRPAAHPATFTFTQDGAYVLIQWTASTLSDTDFNSYVVKVRDVGVPEDDPRNVVVWQTTAKSTAEVRIFKFPRNRPFIMSFYVRKNAFSDYVDSTATSTASTTIRLDSVLLANPTTRGYVILKAHRGRHVAWQQSPTLVQPWGQERPVAMIGGAHSRTVSFTSVLYGTPAEQRVQMTTIEAMYKNASYTPINYIDAFGNFFDIVLDPPDHFVEGGWERTEVSLTGREVDALVVVT
jgi:hypothetical protein